MSVEDSTTSTSGKEELASATKATWGDASRVIIFTDTEVVYSTFDSTPAERTLLAATFDDRDNALRRGLTVANRRYEVHRFHPPLVYGRSMDGNPEQSTGIALLKVDGGRFGSPTYMLITYEMPNVSARMVQMLSDFGTKFLRA